MFSGASSRLRQLQVDGLACAFDEDASVAVLEHASVRRELEAVASEIWRLVEADESLRFDDIAVLVPEGDAKGYGAQVSAVFREAHDLPHCTIAAEPLQLANARSVVEAIELLPGIAARKVHAPRATAACASSRDRRIDG